MCRLNLTPAVSKHRKGDGLFCSSAVLNLMVGHSMDVLSPFISVLCHSDRLFPGNPVHVLTLSIQAVHIFLACMHLAVFLALSRSPDNSLVSSWCDHTIFLALTVSNSSLFTPALLRTQSFVFYAVHEIRRIYPT